jgi:hypothetical protein
MVREKGEAGEKAEKKEEGRRRGHLWVRAMSTTTGRVNASREQRSGEEGGLGGGACLSTGLGEPREVPHSFPGEARRWHPPLRFRWGAEHGRGCLAQAPSHGDTRGRQGSRSFGGDCLGLPIRHASRASLSRSLIGKAFA